MSAPQLPQIQRLRTLTQQMYRRYLPSGYDSSMSIYEQLTIILEYLEEIGVVQNELVRQWEEVVKYVFTKGLDEAVSKKIEEMLNDGRLEQIINVTIFKDLNYKTDALYINVKYPPMPLVGLKLDGTDEAQAFQNMIDSPEVKGKVLVIPEDLCLGKSVILKDVSLLLQEHTKIKAIAPMEYMLDFNTDRKIEKLEDLSQGYSIKGGTLDGQRYAGTVLKLNQFLGFTLETEIKNGINRGLVTGTKGKMSAELYAPHLRFDNDMNINCCDNIAIEVVGTDNHFGIVVVKDWTVGIWDKGNARIESLHHWISHKERFEDSICVKSESSTLIEDLQMDTIRYGVTGAAGEIRINMAKTYHNTVVYDEELQRKFVPEFIHIGDTDPKIHVMNTRINGNTVPIKFVDRISQRTHSLNNIFEGNVINSFLSFWDVYRYNGMNLYSGDKLTGTIATSPTGLNLVNPTSNKTLKLHDNGQLQYNGLEVPSMMEATFVPTLKGASVPGGQIYTTQSGSYTRMGKMCFVSINIAGKYGDDIVGGLSIDGLPLKAGTTVTGVAFGFLNTGGFTNPIGYVTLGGNSVEIRTLDATGSSKAVDSTTLRGKDFTYHLSFVYKVDPSAIPA